MLHVPGGTQIHVCPTGGVTMFTIGVPTAVGGNDAGRVGNPGRVVATTGRVVATPGAIVGNPGKVVACLSRTFHK